MLEGLLSVGAGVLYDSLVRDGAIPLDDARASSAEMTELFDKGFVRRDYRADPDKPRVTPVDPVRAVDNAILVAQQRVIEQQRLIVAARQQLDALQAMYRANNGTSESSAIELITDPKRIGALSVELCLSAREEFVSFTTRPATYTPDPRTAMVFPAMVIQRGVVLRNVYERSALEFDGAREIVDSCLKVGWRLRIISELPAKMVIADRHSALIPLERTGTTGALYIRTSTVVAALRTLFELVWVQAVPIGYEDTTRHGLTPTQAKVLELLATGMTDGAIARYLGVSERTVRRYVCGLLDALQADNRVAAVYAATRLGWLR